MVLMSSELSDATGLGAFPKDWYTAKITDLDDERQTKETSAPMAEVVFTIQTGPFAGKKVFPPYYIMLGGMTAKGDKQNLGRLCEFINAVRIEWKCLGCQTSGVRKFVKNEQQKYLCPDCRQSTAFAYDLQQAKERDVRILLDQEKGLNSDELVNRITRVAELI